MTCNHEQTDWKHTTPEECVEANCTIECMGFDDDVCYCVVCSICGEDVERTYNVLP